MNRQQWLEYFTNLHQNTDLNLVDEFARVNRIDLKHRKVLPAFFTGDILKKNKIVFFSINPQYSENVTEIEQGLHEIPFDNIQEVDYTNWFETCLNRFEFYAAQNIRMHSVFYNFYKMLNNEVLRNENASSTIALKFMQDNVVNIDWIPYYSKGIGTINFYNRANIPFTELITSWSNTFETIIRQTKPKFIFLHGGLGKFRDFIIANTDINLNNEIFNVLSRGKLTPVFRGNSIFNQNVPVIYLSNFINNANGRESIALIYDYLKGEGLVD